MSKTISAAICYDRYGYPIVIARLSPTAYRWCNSDGSFSNSRPGDRACVHMDEKSARALIREDRAHEYPFHVPATDKRFKRRVTALGAAVIAARNAGD